tara:strand:- start:1479 stop:1859 length:381 start_codon:yes stop_codon:yes gene_type:complete
LVEQQLFEYLRKGYYPDLVKAKSQMSRWDCYSPNTYHRIELKCRKKHFDTLLIERKKYDAMVLKCQDNLDIPIYINSTPEGVYRWNLYNVEPEWFTKKIRATTEFANNNLIDKEIALLEVIDAEVL